MNRYSKITDVHRYKREIVLLKSRPCAYGKCTFCDYILDNSKNIDEINAINLDILNNITGEFGILEIINSGNIFELPQATKQRIKEIVKEKNIRLLFVEAHWMYKDHLHKIKDLFETDIFIKTGLESFDNQFREKVLNKGFFHSSPKQLSELFDSVCLLIGVKGQSKEIIKKDIEIAKKHFNHTTLNLYVNNTTSIKADEELKKWFLEEYKDLFNDPQFEILVSNTDFGVGD
ncbi:radical SAM protein [Francisella philomiragia]|uniref:Radical SAM domain protein n=1 Tax=Francisella philomiragia TaxID=28110 RepID=A0AAW3DAD9_9GAMM|nr:radical SAM protein [Francisella philomiragia]KFJ42277.1 putative radical SAM domain protein [Francisella philomiragia]MBK2253857.1 radical SAM protein [Francisella philomiragia]MBK2272169.1 radical SAM protein [Francisella philomiragia]MBK2276011.1 radical SAM protein [Francisella philomiragia]MBK2279958.1 radical SAM protein [Francisella philomiragia]